MRPHRVVLLPPVLGHEMRESSLVSGESCFFAFYRPKLVETVLRFAASYPLLSKGLKKVYIIMAFYNGWMRAFKETERSGPKKNNVATYKLTLFMI